MPGRSVVVGRDLTRRLPTKVFHVEHSYENSSYEIVLMQSGRVALRPNSVACCSGRVTKERRIRLASMRSE